MHFIVAIHINANALNMIIFYKYLVFIFIFFITDQYRRFSKSEVKGLE